MSKYLKWELKDILKKNLVFFIVIGVVYLLAYIGLQNGSEMGFVYLIFYILWIVTLFNAFWAGSKRTMETFEKDTFLLESMIPMSAEKLLLGKYIIAVILNVFYALLFVLGFVMVFDALDPDLLELIGQVVLEYKEEIIKMMFAVITETCAFTSIVTLAYVGIKSFLPAAKWLKTIAFVVGYIINSFIIQFLEEIGIETDIMFHLVMFGIITGCFFGTVWFIKNKLEIYN